jgi:tRNA pseudouridine55 synthase
MLSGALWINKPAELTSSDVVTRLKISLTKNGYCQKGFKIGHGGTLDPFATGALIVLIGEATKLADTYLHSVKSYSGIITLGSQTDTADLTGGLIKHEPTPNLNSNEWQSIADTFVKEAYWQVPPMHSAKKMDGKPLHSFARQGIELDRKAILKKIHQFKVRLIQPDSESKTPELSFEVQCESGTYVRVIAEDLAKKAGTLGHLKTLIRTQTSDVTLEQCEKLESVLRFIETKTPLSELPSFHPIDKVALHLTSIQISESLAESLLAGKKQAVFEVLQSISPDRLESYPRYFVAKLDTGKPVALFERLENKDAESGLSYRMQRVLLWK